MKITEEKIKELTNLGFSRWQKGNMDRLYIDASQLGLVCTYYHTGNIRHASIMGFDISNSEARRMKSAKTFIDVNTGICHSNNDTLRNIACKLANIEEGM